MRSENRGNAGFKYLHRENKNGTIEKQRNCHDPWLVVLPIYVWRLVRMGGYRVQKKVVVNLLEAQSVKMLK